MKNETRNPNELKHHPMLADSPMLAEGHPDRLGIRESLERGWREPVIINERNEIMDGRHRVAEAILMGLDEVPVEVQPDEEAGEIIYRSIISRRHLAKWQVAYTVGPVLESLFGAGKVRQISGLKKGRENPFPQNAVTGKIRAFNDFISQRGISPDTFERAARVRKALHARKDLRARFEPGLFDGTYTLEQVAKALGSIAAYDSGDPTPGKDRHEHDRLIRDYFIKVGKQFANWEKLGASQRREVTEFVESTVLSWPDEVKKAVKGAL